jgi:hypothetical protein
VQRRERSPIDASAHEPYWRDDEAHARVPPRSGATGEREGGEGEGAGGGHEGGGGLT